MVYGVVNILQNRIKIGVRWKKVDSRLEARTYKDGQTPAVDEYSIRLNTVVYEWAGEARVK